MPNPPQKIQDDSKGLKFLYRTVPGRIVLKLLCAPGISKLGGSYLSSSLSKSLIPSFIRKNNIDISLYEECDYHDFNEFFTRKIRPEMRPIDMTPESFTAPCDGLLSVYHIKGDTVIPVKQSRYTIADLLGSEEKAKFFEDGECLVFRLCVDHYHRYAFNDNCRADKPYFIKGRLHTVRPIALEKVPVFTSNSREITFMETENFGTVAQIEVGAMLVGKIKNHEGITRGERGMEKGMFLYGGSTVILLLQKGKVRLFEDFYRNTAEYFETPVVWGEKIGDKE